MAEIFIMLCNKNKRTWNNKKSLFVCFFGFFCQGVHTTLWEPKVDKVIKKKFGTIKTLKQVNLFWTTCKFTWIVFHNSPRGTIVHKGNIQAIGLCRRNYPPGIIYLGRTQDFPKKLTFLTPWYLNDVCVSGDKKW